MRWPGPPAEFAVEPFRGVHKGRSRLRRQQDGGLRPEVTVRKRLDDGEEVLGAFAHPGQGQGDVVLHAVTWARSFAAMSSSVTVAPGRGTT